MVKPLLWGAWSRNKDTYFIALVIAPNEWFLIANFVLVPPNPILTLWETPAINAALPPLVLFFFCPFSLLFFSVLLSSFVFSSSSFFSGETLADSHTLTLAYLPTYLPTKPKYQVPGPDPTYTRCVWALNCPLHVKACYHRYYMPHARVSKPMPYIHKVHRKRFGPGT